MLHYLKAMARAGMRDAVAVNQAMRAMPVDWFGETVTLRQDGRLLVPRPSDYDLLAVSG
jgi:hypothetical protein